MKIFIFFLVFHYIYSLHPVSVIMPVNIRYSAASREGEEVISFSLLTDMDQNEKWLNTSYRSITNLGMVIFST